jgi:hypothetical protein
MKWERVGVRVVVEVGADAAHIGCIMTARARNLAFFCRASRLHAGR